MEKADPLSFLLRFFLFSSVLRGLARQLASNELNQISYARFARQPTIRTFYLMFRPYDVILIISSPIRRTVQ